MKMKRFLAVMMLLALLLLSVSCVKTSVDSTERGASTRLPGESASVTPSATQDGSVSPSTFTIPPSPTPMPAGNGLADIFAAMTNYTVQVASVEDGESWLDETYLVVGNACKFDFEDYYGDTYTDYYTVTDGVMQYYADYTEIDDVYYTVASTEACFGNFEYASYHGFSALEPALFTEASGVYSYSGTLVNSMCKAFLDDTDSAENGKETFKSITIYTDKGVVTKIVVISEYRDYVYGETFEDIYTLTYSAFGSTPAFTLPSNTQTVTDENFEEFFGESDTPDSSEEQQYDYLYVGIPPEGNVNALVFPV